MKHRLLKILFVFLLTTLLVTGCYDLPDRIVFPQWDTDLNLPIANRRFTIDELIKEQGHIVIEGQTVEDSIYILESDLFNLNSDIADFIQLNGTSSVTDVPVLTDSQQVTLYIPFPDGAEIDSAVFLQGFIDLSVDNPSGDEVSLNIVFPGIKDASGSQLFINLNVQPFSSKAVTYNLSNNNYHVLDNQPPEYRNSFQLSASASSLSGVPQLIYVDLTTRDIMFSYVSGLLPPTSLGERQNRFRFAPENTSDYRDKAILREADMILDAQFITPYSNPFPVNVSNLNIIGLRDDGTQFLLRDSTGSENMSIYIDDGSVRKIFNENNSNITDFISFLPDTILLQAEYIINPANQHGSVAITDSIKFEVTFKTKSFIALKKSTMVDSTEITLTQEQKDAIKEGNTASVTIELENAVPLTGWLKIDLVDENHNRLFTISKNSNGTDTLFFDGAPVGSDGEVTGSFVNPPVTISLSTSEIDMLTRAKFAVVSVTVQTSDAFKNPPTIVAVRPNAWVKIRAYGSINYRVKPEGY